MKKPTPGQKLQSFKKPAPKPAPPMNLSGKVAAAGPMTGAPTGMPPFKGKPKFGGKKPPFKGGGKF